MFCQSTGKCLVKDHSKGVKKVFLLTELSFVGRLLPESRGGQVHGSSEPLRGE